jgi:lipopolysaccharide/colanic/teichoic acid biosynthesis glycosyltransferase
MYKHFPKRFLDIVLALLMLVFFFPVCVVVALAIKLDSSGPIFADVPKRVGKQGKPFKMFKFRSMIVNAHSLLRQDPEFAALYAEYKKNSFKLNNDPRVTRIGRFIRKYSLDELPQIINVLRGEMSVVGPRAYYQDELDHQSHIYPDTKSKIQHVLEVRPGITGLWQVSGRSAVNFDRRILIDDEYAQNVTFWGDLCIIARTPLAMLTGKGAV